MGPEEYREFGAWSDRTYLDEFLEVAARQPDQVAVVTTRAGHAMPESISYGQLARLVDRFAGALLELGVGPGAVVSLQLPNWWQFPALAMATARVGATINPLVPIFRHRELSFILERTEAKVCVVPASFRGFAHGELLRGLAKELPSLEHVFVLGEDFEGHFIERRWEDAPGLAGRLEALRPRPTDLAEIQFTSGTTGEPKGVEHTYDSIRGSSLAGPTILGTDATAAGFMASTLAHQTGFLFGFVVPLSHGAKVVYQDVWDPAAALSILSDEDVTWTVGATPFVLDLVEAQRRDPRPLESFRLFVCGGAPIPPHAIGAAHEYLGAELIAVWGMTENGIVTLTRPGDPVDLVTQSDGTPVPWMEVRVVDDDGAELAVGASGRLQVRGASQTPGYFKRGDLYEESCTGDGWFDTGDMAWRREDGGIRIAGRYKDLVIRGGENVPVGEVEAVLYTHAAVREVAVVGYPDERLGERSCAVIVPAELGEAPTLQELAAHCEAAGMARQFWPERLVVLDDLPKTPSGKVQKFKVRELVLAVP
ncbi:MAG: AMP-binding protein [Acidimicrobiia bacterium]|nr:AMP-binding protein [Acidimicrobiia bacterium]